MSHRIAFLGPAGTYSEQALLQYSSDAIELPFGTEREAILAVADGAADEAVVPIENSIEGGVRGTLDTLAGSELGLRIVAELTIPIKHSLIGPEPNLEVISRVVSHPQPLAQCAPYLAEHLPHAEQIAARSTADAVRIVAEEGGPQAAIGSSRAAELYGLPVIAAGIENDPGNVTRFVVVANEAAPADGPGPFKTTIVFHGAGDDSPGWLVSCLSEFATRSINLTKIESRPQPGRLGHYLFVIDLEGAERDTQVQDAVAGLRTRCESVRLLGTYRPG